MNKYHWRPEYEAGDPCPKRLRLVECGGEKCCPGDNGPLGYRLLDGMQEWLDRMKLREQSGQ